MSVENGTIGQYQAFYGERVTLPSEVLTLELAAVMGFNLENIFSDISFPPTFWSALQILTQKLSMISLQSIQHTEEKITADTLLTAFGAVTTAETIEPHRELTGKAQETHAQLVFSLTESKLAFATMISQLKKMIISFHQEQLLSIPSEDDDEKVNQYLSKTGQRGNSVINKSLDNSQRAFSIQQRKRKKSRERVQESLELWTIFTTDMSRIIWGGNEVVEQQIKNTSI